MTRNKEEERRNEIVNLVKKIGTIAGIVIVVSLIVFNSFTIIGPSQRGVMVTLGKAGDNVIEPGLKFKAPFFQRVKKYSVTPNDFKASFGIGDDGAVTSDMQTVGLESTVYWVYDEGRLVEAVKGYDSSSINSMIRSAMLASVKEVIGHYTAQEVIENQSQVSSEVLNSMNSKLADRPINVTMIAISNYNWSAEYDKMINETMLKKQQVKQAEQEVQITELNAQKKVKEAEAAKQVTELNAEASKITAEKNAEAAKIAAEKQAEANLVKAQKEAEAILLKAQAEADAKKLQADADAYYYAQLAKNLDVQTTIRELDIQQERAESWDGREIPNYIPLTVSGSPVVMN